MAKFDTLLKRRKEIAAQVSVLNKEAEDIDRILHDALNTFIQAYERVNPPTAVSVVFQTSTATATGVVFRRGNTLEAQIASVLEDADRPMRPQEIYEELVKRGVQVNGKKPANNVSAHLSNSDRFTKSGGGWVLREPKLISEKTNAPGDIFR